MSDKEDLAVLKAVVQLPLIPEEIEILRNLTAFDLLSEHELDDIQLLELQSWLKHEQQRYSSSYYTFPNKVVTDDDMSKVVGNEG